MQSLDPRLALAVFALLAASVAVLAWPRVGVLARVRRMRRATARVRAEDALKYLYHAESNGRVAADALAGALGLSPAAARGLCTELASRGLVQVDAGTATLTPQGREAALRLVRAHRLLERWLADHTGVEPAEWHAWAEDVEHDLSPVDVERLAARLGHPRYDPHGDPIPTATGELPVSDGVPLSALAVGDAGRIVHVEDEPAEAFSLLQREGVALDKPVAVLERHPSTLIVELDGRAVPIPRMLEPAITVARTPRRATTPPRTLADLAPGESGRVLSIDLACRGAQRRRLLDLGVVPGTAITAVMQSAGGDPMAYEIRGALIALRRTQAAWIVLDDRAA